MHHGTHKPDVGHVFAQQHWTRVGSLEVTAQEHPKTSPCCCSRGQGHPQQRPGLRYPLALREAGPGVGKWLEPVALPCFWGHCFCPLCPGSWSLAGGRAATLVPHALPEEQGWEAEAASPARDDAPSLGAGRAWLPLQPWGHQWRKQGSGHPQVSPSLRPAIAAGMGSATRKPEGDHPMQPSEEPPRSAWGRDDRVKAPGTGWHHIKRLLARQPGSRATRSGGRAPGGSKEGGPEEAMSSCPVPEHRSAMPRPTQACLSGDWSHLVTSSRSQVLPIGPCLLRVHSFL